MRQERLDAGPYTSTLEMLEPRLCLDSAAPSAEAFVHERRRVVAIETADFDGDGDLDMAVLTSRARVTNPWKSVLFVLTNDGHGNFEHLAQRRFRSSAPVVVSGDFNGDGRAELGIGSINGDATSLLRLFELDLLGDRLVHAHSLTIEGAVQELNDVPAGESADSILILSRPPGDVETPVTEGRIARLGESGLVLSEPVFAFSTHTFASRIVDADGDAHHDILVMTASPRSSDHLHDVTLRVYRQDAFAPGEFNAGNVILTYEAFAPFGAPLLTDLDQDGTPDVVAAAIDVFGTSRVLFFRASNGDYESPEVLHETVTGGYPVFASHRLYGSGPGPTGSFEIWLASSYGVAGGSLPTTGNTSMLRLVQQSDGQFEPRALFGGLERQSRQVNGHFHLAQLTSDGAMDFIAVTRRSGIQPRRDSTILVATSEVTNRSPLVSAPTARSIQTPTPRLAATGDTVLFQMAAFDPDELLGEGGGIQRVRFYFDLNGNGIIDAADRRIAAGASTFYHRTVRPAWPRGTFHVLAQARDTEGNWSGAACSALPLTIV